jgi:hypothetical protein
MQHMAFVLKKNRIPPLIFVYYCRSVLKKDICNFIFERPDVIADLVLCCIEGYDIVDLILGSLCDERVLSNFSSFMFYRRSESMITSVSHSITINLYNTLQIH